MIMNIRWKVALLTLLGFSTSACCGTKKAAKSEDKKEADILIKEVEDPRIQLMYGVPFPDGRVAIPVDENGKPIEAELKKDRGLRQPDGGMAVPVTDEEAQQLVEKVKEAEAAKAE
jgi:hypothetical protein